MPPEPPLLPCLGRRTRHAAHPCDAAAADRLLPAARRARPLLRDHHSPLSRTGRARNGELCAAGDADRPGDLPVLRRDPPGKILTAAEAIRMMLNGWLQIGATLALGFAISVPTGRYLARVFMDQKTVFDRVMDPIDNLIYAAIGRKAARQPMDWRAYTFHMLATNAFMAIIIYLVLVLQDHVP